MRRITNSIAVVALLLFLNSCGGGASANPKPDSGPSPVAIKYAVALEFNPVPLAGLDAFQINIAIQDNGVDKSGVADQIEVELSRGSASGLIELSAGHYQTIVTPNLAGEHRVTVRYHDQSITQTVLVFEQIHADWGQPMAVSGMVNTEGYEDGAVVSEDGRYLFVQYSPIRFSALIAFGLPREAGGCSGNRLEYPLGTPNLCSHDWYDKAIGPYAAPERPEFFDGRIAGGMFLHNSASWGIGNNQLSLLTPSTMFYGFKRQADGSYAEPFYLAFDDENDGIINPYGLSIRTISDTRATATFTMNNPSDGATIDLDGDGVFDVESGFDLYTRDFTLGQNTLLGSFHYSGVPASPPIMAEDRLSQKIDFGSIGILGNAGTQGNSHMYTVDGLIRSVWTDDEYDEGGDRGNLSVYVLQSGVFPVGSWTKVELPAQVNKPSPQNEYQPFFTGKGLYYASSNSNENPSILYSAYSGSHSASDFSKDSNWAPSEIILKAVSDAQVGEIVAVGEPSIAIINGEEYLYFVYASIRGYVDDISIPDINMQVGYIKKNHLGNL